MNENGRALTLQYATTKRKMKRRKINIKQANKQKHKQTRTRRGIRIQIKELINQ
jgi:hypothetical protein